MKYQVIVSDRVKQGLAMQIPFLGQLNKSAAQKLRTKLVSEIRSLGNMPHRYPFFNEEYLPANKYHKLFVENWYLIIYQIRDNTVYVEWIVDCRQDYQWLLR